jgi:hypothetical protein
MQAMTIDQWVDLLPPGPDRADHESLAKQVGPAWIVQPSYSTALMWLVSGKLHLQALRLAGVPRSQAWTLRALQDFFGACGDAVKTLEEAAELFTSTAPREEQGQLSA